MPVDVVHKSPRIGHDAPFLVKYFIQVRNTHSKIVKSFWYFDPGGTCLAVVQRFQDITKSIAEESHRVNSPSEVDPSRTGRSKCSDTRPEWILVRGNIHKFESFKLS